MVAQEQREGAAVAGTLRGGEAFGDFLLHEYRHGLETGRQDELFENRRRDVVGQIRADHRRQALETFRRERGEVEFKRVALYNFDVFEAVHRLRENREQGAVEFHRYDFPGALRQFRRQRAHARPDFQYAAVLVRTGGVRNRRRDFRVNQEVLPHGFREPEAVAFQQGA